MREQGSHLSRLALYKVYNPLMKLNSDILKYIKFIDNIWGRAERMFCPRFSLHPWTPASIFSFYLPLSHHAVAAIDLELYDGFMPYLFVKFFWCLSNIVCLLMFEFALFSYQSSELEHQNICHSVITPGLQVVLHLQPLI